MRSLLAVLAGATAAALGALILAEYELVGVGAVLTAAAFGAVLAELMGTIDRSPPPWLLAVAALVAAGGVWWARAIQWRVTIERGEQVPVEVTLGAAVAAIAAAVVLSRKRRTRTAAGS